MPVDRRTYDILVELLQTTRQELMLFGGILIISLALFIVGVIAMIDDHAEKVFAIQPVVFLVAQSFTLTTVWRDRTLFDPHDLHYPTKVRVRQTIFFFVVAVGLVVVSFATIAKWRTLYAATSLWVMSSAVGVSRVMRNRNYGFIFADAPDNRRDKLSLRMSAILKGSLESRIYIYLSSLIAVAELIVVVWAWPEEDLSTGKKGFITVCALWCASSCTHLGKLVRDRQDPSKTAELKEQIPFQIMVVCSWIMSTGMIVLIITALKLNTSQRLHLIVAWGYALSAVIWLSTHMRDRAEISFLGVELELEEEEELQPTKPETIEINMTAIDMTASVPPLPPPEDEPRVPYRQPGGYENVYPQDIIIAHKQMSPRQVTSPRRRNSQRGYGYSLPHPNGYSLPQPNGFHPMYDFDIKRFGQCGPHMSEMQPQSYIVDDDHVPVWPEDQQIWDTE